MKKRIFKIIIAIAIVFVFASPGISAELKSGFEKVPIKGVPTMIDIGAKKCIPCKMMIPVMEKVETSYKGRAKIVFIDVWDHRDQAGRFSIRSIPTQIFFDTSGKEVFRHVGFLSEKEIIAQFAKMGIAPVKNER